jgi:4-carboxymuconolactone decarboxylase
VYTKEESMGSKQPTPTARELIGDIAPKLIELREDVLFGDIWERPGLSKRDRSLITVATLVALNRTDQLPFHLRRALENGITKDEIIELITHLAFYPGWPHSNVRGPSCEGCLPARRVAGDVSNLLVARTAHDTLSREGRRKSERVCC